MNQKQTLNSSQQICFDNDMSQQFRNYFQKLLSKYILCVYTSYNTFLYKIMLHCAQSLSCVQLFATPWVVARQPPLSMGILQARILEWLTMPCSRGSSHPGMEPRSPALQVGSEPPAKPIQNYVYTYIIKKLYIYIYIYIYIYQCHRREAQIQKRLL